MRPVRRTIWRYGPLLPVSDSAPIDLGVGLTPLVRADRLAAELGLGELWVKNDTANPTGSFKDRVVSVALTKARELGFKVAACASTGNLANSVAAHAAHAGMASVVFIPKDLERGQGGHHRRVRGTCRGGGGNLRRREPVVRRAGERASDVGVRERELAHLLRRGFEDPCLRGRRTARLAGSRSCRGTGGLGQPARQGRKGFRELHEVGLLEEEPHVRVSGAQAAGCAPVATAFAEGADAIRPVQPDTIAKSLAIGNPADGWYALEEVRSSGGAFAAASDDEIVDAIRLLARTEGIFAETAGGVTVAMLAKLAAQGIVRRDERVVVYVTGHGLKTVEALRSVGPTATIKPSLDAFAATVDIDSYSRPKQP